MLKCIIIFCRRRWNKQRSCLQTHILPRYCENTRVSTRACVHTYTLTGGTSPSICSSSSSEVGARAAVLLSTLRPPALRAVLSLLLSTSASPWLHSESPGVRQNDDSVDTRTRRLRFNLWRLCEAPRLGWEGCRNRGLMKHGDRGLDDQLTDTAGGPLGGPGEAWELQNSETSKNIRLFIKEIHW